MSGMDKAKTGEPISLDEQIEQLVSIGWYMVDRWSAMNDVKPGAHFEKRQQEALDTCTSTYMSYLQTDAQSKLRGYLDRKRPILDGAIILKQLDALKVGITSDVIAALPPKRRRWFPKQVTWALAETGAGPLAAFGVIIFAIIVRILDPKLHEEGLSLLYKLLGPEPAAAAQNPSMKPQDKTGNKGALASP